MNKKHSDFQTPVFRWILELTLSENCVSIKSSHDDVSVTLPVDKDKVQRSIKRQVSLQ